MPSADSSAVTRLNFALQESKRTVYSQFLGRTLAARVKELAVEGSQCSLHAELELTRALVPDALLMYEESVRDAEAAGVTPLKLASIRLAASNVIHAALERVAAMAVAHRKVTTDAMVDMRVVQTLIIQAAQGFDGVLQEWAPKLLAAGINPQLLSDQCAQRLAEVRLPATADEEPVIFEQEMTSLVPADREAQMMDDTIPHFDEYSEAG